MMTCDEMIAVIQHHKDGGEVEVFKDKSWNKIVGDPSWNFRDCMYRPYIEPKPKKVVVIEKWLIKDRMSLDDTIIYRTVELQQGFINEMMEVYDCDEKVILLDTYEVEI